MFWYLKCLDQLACRDDVGDCVSSGAKSTSGVWQVKVTVMTTVMNFIFQTHSQECRCSSTRTDLQESSYRLLNDTTVVKCNALFTKLFPYCPASIVIPILQMCEAPRGTGMCLMLLVEWTVGSWPEPQFPDSRLFCPRHLPRWYHAPCSSGDRSSQANDRGLQLQLRTLCTVPGEQGAPGLSLRGPRPLPVYTLAGRGRTEFSVRGTLTSSLTWIWKQCLGIRG